MFSAINLSVVRANQIINRNLYKNNTGDKNVTVANKPLQHSHLMGSRYLKSYFYNITPATKNFSFGGKPKYRYCSKSSSPLQDAVSCYQDLNNPDYTNIHDDLYNPQYKQIRESNYYPLTCLSSSSDKKSFIEYFKKRTGFPDLQLVSSGIENHFVNLICSAEIYFWSKEYNCIAAGYDDTCSVGKGVAFPGSDIDKSYIILRGCDDAEKNEQIVNKYKEYLWNHVKQNILSFNHDTSFPTVYTLKQIKDLNGAIKPKAKSLRDKYSFYASEWCKLINEEYRDVYSAALYNRMLSSYFIDKSGIYDKYNYPAKSDVKNFAFFIETFRDGKLLVNLRDANELRNLLSSNPFYQYSNVSQIRAMRNAVARGDECKSKSINKKKLITEFDKMSLDDQYSLVIDIIKYSSEDNSGNNKYFKNDRDVKAAYEKLLGVLSHGEGMRFHPNISMQDGVITINYLLSSPNVVKLYPGYDESVLWIDTTSFNVGSTVSKYIDDIKKLAIFSNLHKVQFAPYYYPDDREGFYITQQYDSKENQILEKQV